MFHRFSIWLRAAQYSFSNAFAISLPMSQNGYPGLQVSPGEQRPVVPKQTRPVRCHRAPAAEGMGGGKVQSAEVSLQHFCLPNNKSLFTPHVPFILFSSKLWKRPLRQQPVKSDDFFWQLSSRIMANCCQKHIDWFENKICNEEKDLIQISSCWKIDSYHIYLTVLTSVLSVVQHTITSPFL